MSLSIEARLNYLEKKQAIFYDLFAKITEELAILNGEIEVNLGTRTETTKTEDGWYPQRDGGQCLELDKIDPLLREHLTIPKSKYENGLYSYRGWTGRDQKLMVSRYKKRPTT